MSEIFEVVLRSVMVRSFGYLHASRGYGCLASHPGASWPCMSLILILTSTRKYQEENLRRDATHGTVTTWLQILSPKMFKTCTGSGRVVRSVDHFSVLGGGNLRCAGSIDPLKTT